MNEFKYTFTGAFLGVVREIVVVDTSYDAAYKKAISACAERENDVRLRLQSIVDMRAVPKVVVK